MVGDLEEVGGKHRVFMWTDTLSFAFKPQFLHIGIFDDLKLVALFSTTILFESCALQPYCFGYQGCEVGSYIPHLVYVIAVCGFEIRHVGRRGPLGGSEEVAVERLGGFADGVVGGEVDLFAVVDGMGCYFCVKAGVS